MEEISIKISLSGNGKYIAITGKKYKSTITHINYVRVFKLEEDDTWNQFGNDIIMNKSEEFTTTVYMAQLSNDGSILAVGTDIMGASKIGKVAIFKYDDNSESYILRGDVLTDNAMYNQFGKNFSLSGDGNRIAISSHKKVFIYHWRNNKYTKFNSTFTKNSDNSYFGKSISLSKDGNMLAIGDHDVDIVRMYRFTPRNKWWSHKWIPIQNITENNSSSEFEFGFDVSLSSNNYMAVGSNVNENTGKVDIYSGNKVIFTINNVILGFNNNIKLSDDGQTLIIPEIYTDESLIETQVFRLKLDENNKIKYEKVVSKSVGKSVDISNDGNTLAIGYDDRVDIYLE